MLGAVGTSISFKWFAFILRLQPGLGRLEAWISRDRLWEVFFETWDLGVPKIRRPNIDPKIISRALIMRNPKKGP